MAQVLFLQGHDKPIFLKLLWIEWERYPKFDASNTILLDCRNKLLKNDYKNCLAIKSYDPMVIEANDQFYLADVILPWLLGWIRDPYPRAYTRKHPIRSVQDEVSSYVTTHFLAVEGYSYKFDPPCLGEPWTISLVKFSIMKHCIIWKPTFLVYIVFRPSSVHNNFLSFATTPPNLFGVYCL